MRTHAPEKLISIQRLKELLYYDPLTGIFMWRRGGGKRSTVRPAGRVNTNGYRDVTVDGVSYLAHRLAWFYVTGEWPAEEIERNGTPYMIARSPEEAQAILLAWGAIRNVERRAA